MRKLFNMSWNYRILVTKKNGYKHYNIHRVYYGSDGEIQYWSEEPTYPSNPVSVANLICDLRLMCDAHNKPVLMEIHSRLVVDPESI